MLYRLLLFMGLLGIMILLAGLLFAKSETTDSPGVQEKIQNHTTSMAPKDDSLGYSAGDTVSSLLSTSAR